MAGCFGNSDYDRNLERELFDYLDSFNLRCQHCNFKSPEEDWDYDIETHKLICPNCKNEVKD